MRHDDYSLFHGHLARERRTVLWWMLLASAIVGGGALLVLAFLHGWSF